MQNFKDQVAIVTGGFQGLGRAISEVLVANGCSVLVFDIAGNEDTCSAILAKAPPGMQYISSEHHSTVPHQRHY